MSYQRTANQLIIDLPESVELEPEEIERFLKYLRYRVLVSKSTAKQEEIDALARQAKSEWWEENKHRFLPEFA